MKDCFKKIHEQTLKIIYDLFLEKIKKEKRWQKKKTSEAQKCVKTYTCGRKPF